MAILAQNRKTSDDILEEVVRRFIRGICGLGGEAAADMRDEHPHFTLPAEDEDCSVKTENRGLGSHIHISNLFSRLL